MSDTKRPVAEPDSITQPWWDAAAQERLVIQHCRACDENQHYPRPVCKTCGATDLDFLESSGRGTVHSFTIVNRAPHPAFTTPYVVALVDLDEGVRLMTNIVGCDPDDVSCDMRVRVSWEPLDDGRKLPVFTKAKG